MDNTAERPRPVPELLLVAALFLAYKLGRLAVAGDITTAYTNANHLWDLERTSASPAKPPSNTPCSATRD